MSIINQLKEFLDSGKERGNQWIANDEMQVYIRKGQRYINERKVKAFEIANIIVGNQGKRIFTSFLEEAEKVVSNGLVSSRFDIIFIENVLEERFQKFFEKRGYVYCKNSIPPCYCKELKARD